MTEEKQPGPVALPGIWGTVALALGAVVTIGTSVIDTLGADSYYGILAGTVVAVAASILRSLKRLKERKENAG